MNEELYGEMYDKILSEEIVYLVIEDVAGEVTLTVVKRMRDDSVYFMSNVVLALEGERPPSSDDYNVLDLYEEVE